jgi:hypothetical protein
MNLKIIISVEFVVKNMFFLKAAASPPPPGGRGGWNHLFKQFGS